MTLHSALIRNLIKLKATSKPTARGDQVCLKDYKYILFEILANRTWKGPNQACWAFLLPLSFYSTRSFGMYDLRLRLLFTFRSTLFHFVGILRVLTVGWPMPPHQLSYQLKYTLTVYQRPSRLEITLQALLPTLYS